jgi:hypothetical protein
MCDQRIEKWRRWVDEAMKEDILGMHLRRDVWLKTQEVLRENEALPESYWWRFMFDTYAEAQAAAVRRQVYADKDARSLGRLLLEVGKTPELLTRELCLCGSTVRDPLDAMARRTWDEQYGGALGEHLDPAIPKADLERLRSESAKVVGWVDRHIAHSTSGRSR